MPTYAGDRPLRDPLAEVTRLERRTLDAGVRARPEELAALLHPDFREHGKSGRAWTRDDVVAAVAGDLTVPGEVVDLAAVALAIDVVLVTYRITGPTGSLRSSVWVREPGRGWAMLFHQGTAAPSDAVDG